MSTAAEHGIGWLGESERPLRMQANHAGQRPAMNTTTSRAAGLPADDRPLRVHPAALRLAHLHRPTTATNTGAARDFGSPSDPRPGIALNHGRPTTPGRAAPLRPSPGIVATDWGTLR